MAAPPPQPRPPQNVEATRAEPTLDLVTNPEDRGASGRRELAEVTAPSSPGAASSTPAHSFIRRLKSPYLGLRPYSQDDADVFFGREEEVRRVVERLERQRLAAVVGPRSSGKTSLARAGVGRALCGGVSDRLGAQWSIAHVIPGERPLEALRDGLIDVAQRIHGCLESEEPKPSELQARQRLIAASLDGASDALHRAAQHALTGTSSNLLLVVDQLERLLARPSREAVYFVQLLLRAAQLNDQHGRPRVFVVFVLRDDAVGGSANFSGLSSALSAGSVLLGRPTREQLQRMIVEPAAFMGWRVTNALRDQLLLDLECERIPVPLLSHAMHGLSTRPGHDQELDVADYIELGGLRRAIDRHAELLYSGNRTLGLEALEGRRARLARELFQCLLQWDDGQVSAREVSVAEVAEACDIAPDDSDLRAVVRRFTGGASPLIRPTPNDMEPWAETALELMDLGVIGYWKRLRDWGRRAQRDARAYQALVSAALASTTWTNATRSAMIADPPTKGPRATSTRSTSSRVPPKKPARARATATPSTAMASADASKASSSAAATSAPATSVLATAVRADGAELGRGVSHERAAEDVLVEPQLTEALRWWEERRPTLGWAKRHHAPFLAPTVAGPLGEQAGQPRIEHRELFINAQLLIERSQRYAEQQAEAERHRQLALAQQTELHDRRQRVWRRGLGILLLLSGTGFLLFVLQRQQAHQQAREARERYVALSDSKQQIEAEAERLQTELTEKTQAEQRLAREKQQLTAQRDRLTATVERQSEAIEQLEQRNKQITQAHDAALRATQATKAELTQVRGQLAEVQAQYGTAVNALTVCRSQLVQSSERAARCEGGTSGATATPPSGGGR